MSLSSGGIARSTKYTHESQYSGSDKGTVKIRSCRVRIAGGLGVHHCIYVAVPTKDKWVVHEWDFNGRSSYACKKICGYDCMTLGQHTLDEVYAAVKRFEGSTYGTRFNCNIWTERVARELGYNITVNWNCSCVLSDYFPVDLFDLV
jgi:hypothetical protein